MSKSISLEEQNICVDVYNRHIEKIGVKDLKVEKRDVFLNKWIEREKSIKKMPPLSNAITVAYSNKDKRDGVAENFLASLMCKGNDFANQNYTALFSAPYVSAGALSITPNNFEKSMIIHTVRRLPHANWLNDRDQLMQPIGDVLQDEEFVTDCVLWSLFSASNDTASISNVKYGGEIYHINNQLFPFLIEEVKKWQITNIDIKSQLWAKNEERYAAQWLSNHKLSEESKSVLAYGKKVYEYFYEHFNEIAWPKYKIHNWDAGWWQIRMALNDAGLGQELLEFLYEAHKNLGRKIMIGIYHYHFIEPDFKEVNT